MRTLSLTVFQAPQPPDAQDTADILARLTGKRFVGIDRGPQGEPCTIEASQGWSHHEDYMLDPGDLLCGPYVRFGLRRDARRIPTATKDKFYRIKLRDWKEKERGASGEHLPLEGTGAKPKPINPDPKAPRNIRAELKKAAKEELLARCVPEPRHAELVWNRNAGLLYLHSTSAAMVKALESLWPATWGDAALTALTPGRRIEAAGYEMPERVVGAEFLTWLWKRAQQNAHAYQLADILTGDFHDVTVEIVDRMALESGQDRDTEKVILSGDLERMEEAEKAIAAGRLVVRARLELRNKGGESWALALDAVDMSVTGLSLPPVPDDLEDTESEPQAREVFRLRLLEKGLGYLGSLYETWMQEQARRGGLRRACAPEGPILAKGKKKAAAKAA